MKHTFLVILALVLVVMVPTSAQYESGKLALILSDEALEDMTIENDGSATLPNATSLNSLNSQNELVAIQTMQSSPTTKCGMFTKARTERT